MQTIARTRQGPIEYRDVGAGPAVLVLNGGHTHCASPFGHERFFRDSGYRLIVPSRPGYGRTPAATGRSAEAAADAMAGLLDALELDQVVVVGISGAGPTALQLAARHPARVRALILQNAVTGARFPTPAIRLGSYVAFNRWLEGGTWAAFRAFARIAPRRALLLVMGGLTVLAPAQVVATMSPAQRRGALAMLTASRSGAGFLLDLHHQCGDLARIHVPALIIASRYDGAVGGAHATYAADRIPGASLYIAPAESHLLWFSTANAGIEARMRAFLQGLPRG